MKIDGVMATNLMPGKQSEQLKHYAEKFSSGETTRWDLAAHLLNQSASEIESLTAERDELKRRLDEEIANMDATMQGWEKLCADSERDALQIESLTAERDRLLKRVRSLETELATEPDNPNWNVMVGS